MGWEDPLEKEKGKGYPLQYYGLEKSMDCIVHEVAKSQTRLSDFHFYFQGKNAEVDHILSELSTETHLPWVAGMVWFITSLSYTRL